MSFFHFLSPSKSLYIYIALFLSLYDLPGVLSGLAKVTLMPAWRAPNNAGGNSGMFGSKMAMVSSFFRLAPRMANNALANLIDMC